MCRNGHATMPWRSMMMHMIISIILATNLSLLCVGWNVRSLHGSKQNGCRKSVCKRRFHGSCSVLLINKWRGILCKHLNVKIVLQNQTHEGPARRIFVVKARCVIPILKWSVIRLLNL
jgi:hypothetical protein